MQEIRYTIEGHPGIWTRRSTEISELGFILVLFQNATNKQMLTINMGTLESALKTRTPKNQPPGVDGVYEHLY